MSTHKSFIRPKRASTRFSATRETYQIDPRYTNLPDVMVSPVPCGTAGNRKYRLAIDGSKDKIDDLNSLSEMLEDASGLKMTIFENVLSTIAAVIPKHIAKTGESVRIGNLVTLAPCVTGSIANANDEPDPANNRLEIRATVSPAMRHSLAKTRLVNVKSKKNAIDRVICDADWANRDVIDAEHVILVNGTNIYVPPQSAEDRGKRGRVWVESLDGELLGGFKVESSGPSLVSGRFVPNRKMGPCEVRIVVETYGTEEAAAEGDKKSLAKYTRDVWFGDSTQKRPTHND